MTKKAAPDMPEVPPLSESVLEAGRLMWEAPTGREALEISKRYLVRYGIGPGLIPPSTRDAWIEAVLRDLVTGVARVDSRVTSLEMLDGRTHLLSPEALAVALRLAPSLTSYEARVAAYCALGYQAESDLIVPAFLRQFWAVDAAEDVSGTGERWACLAALEANHVKAVSSEDALRILRAPEQADVAWLALFILSKRRSLRAEVIPLAIDYGRRGPHERIVLGVLRRMRAVEGRAFATECLTREDARVRDEATEALKAFDRIEGHGAARA